MKDNVLSMLGIVAKSGKIASGEFATEKSIKSDMSYLVIVADDASENTKKQFKNMTEFYQVKLYFYGTKESLGRSIGKEYRSSLSINDENLANAVEKKLLLNKTE